MKLIILIMTTLLLEVSASGFAQKITFSQKKAPIKAIFKEITRQTGHKVICDGQLMSAVPATDVNFKDATLQQVFDHFFSSKAVEWTIKDNTIIIRKDSKPSAKVLPVVEKTDSRAHIKAVAKEIRGMVSDTVGPLPGVSISVKNRTQIGTTTDLNGRYSLDVLDESAIVIFSMVGYETQEIPVRGKSVINVTLKVSNNQLDETVVVAFGKQKKESVIGSITTINPGELKVPSSNLTTALAGRLAGIIAYQRSGEPGADNADFFIRGATTFGYKQDPLILIDGMEYTTTDLARLQPDDIQEFSILKDATATALYGARGANGVILVTTKQGKAGTPKIDVRLESSISSPTRDIELADAITYMRLHNESVLTRDPLGATIYPQSKIDNTISGVNPIVFPIVDWQDQLFKKQTINQRMNASLGGGGQVSTYYVSATYNQDNGVLKVDPRNNFNTNIDLKSFNLRSNVNINVSKSTKLGIRLNGNFDDYSGPLESGEDIYKKVMRTPQTRFLPYYTPTESTAYINHTMFGNAPEGGALNPYADMVKGYKEYSRSLMVAQLELNQDFSFVTEGLSLNGMMNTNRRSYFDVKRQYTPFWYAVTNFDKVANTYDLTGLNQGAPEEGGGTDWLNYVPGSKTVSTTFHLQSALNYSRTFGKVHNVSGMAILQMHSESNGDANTLQGSLPSRNLGVSGRATYSYDNRYFFEFNFGYNGSERFSVAQRFGFFPSVGAAWALSNEKFFEPYKGIVNKLRLRGNIGLAGNDAIGSASERFFYLSEVNMNESGYGSSFGTDGGYRRNGFSIIRYENPDVTWETTQNSTFGLEVGLWNKLDITAEYFVDHRYNILMNRASIPQTMGLQATPKANVGEVRSKSYELQMTYDERLGSNWSLQARGNFTYSKNKFENYEEPNYEQPWLFRKGHSTSQEWGYIAERLFVDDEEVRNSPTQQFNSFITKGGDIKFRDINGDGQITSLDKVAIGHPKTPEIIYGFGFMIAYKNFDVNFFAQGSARSSFWVDVNATAPFVGDNQLLKYYADDHWSEENRNLYALWPRLTSTVNGNNDETSTWFMRNGSFLRLKQVEAGYTFPKKLTRKLKIENLRLYSTATNLFTFSKFKMWDVEMAGRGLGYPIQRVINFGVKVGF